ncbi:hypothetical protein BDR26DRAFT_861284 [Obelidium mucronatum]|nr:hypothetical protein BDR26DRAFT_861284 [Obelidium mucronatum]
MKLGRALLFVALTASATANSAKKKCAPKYAAVVVATPTTTVTTVAPEPEPIYDQSLAPAPEPQAEVDAPIVLESVPEEVQPAPDAEDVIVESNPIPEPEPPFVESLPEPDALPAPEPRPEVETPAPPAPVPQPPVVVVLPTVCTKGTMDFCKVLANTDTPPNVKGLSVDQECTILANYARSHYSGAGPLVWNEKLAEYATASAKYAAENNCSHCHTNSGSGTSWGQNLYTGKDSCTNSYHGWVTNEALGNDPHNLDAGHFKNIVGFEVDYKTIGCGSFVAASGMAATVCNYGLRVL